MKRRIAIIMLLLIGGAIVNVAVAWSFCAYSKPKQANVSGARPVETMHLLVYLPEEIHELRQSRDEFRFRDNDPRVFSTERSRGVHLTSWTLQYSYVQRHPFGEMTWKGPLIRFDECRTGWPKRSFHSMKVATSSPLSHERRFESSTALEWRIHEWHLVDGLPVLHIPAGTRFPFAIVYPGFIINTLFYALLLWLLFFAPFAARRMIRRRRGLCEKCAYPIGVSPVCTECGAAVDLRTVASKRLQS